MLIYSNMAAWGLADMCAWLPGVCSAQGRVRMCQWGPEYSRAATFM